MGVSLIPWVCAVAGVAFVAFCVRDNRKTGFRRDRSEVSILQEGLLWIEGVEAALSEAPQKQSSINASAPASPIAGMEETLAGTQLMNLSHALAESKSSGPITVTNDSIRASEEQTAFDAHDHLSELAPETTPPLQHCERRSDSISG